MSTGEKVRRIRKEIGLTQQELGTRMGRSKQHISEIERGYKDCYKPLRSLAEALQVPCQELLDDVDLGKNVITHKTV